MNGFSFRPAKRENVSLLIGLSGGTGSGKTYSAMRLASGIAKGKPFAVIDTEAGRAKHYADQFKFDHGDLMPPFRPQSYIDAIMAADKAGYPVIVVDSVSHVWAGDGGVLDWQEEELTRMAGDDWKRREACKMAAWIRPKMAHKQMVQKLLQVRAHLILCFRAEEKVEMIRGQDGKMQIQKKEGPTGLGGWMPVCEKNLPFELTTSFLLLADAPGIPHAIKLEEQHKELFRPGQPIDEQSGERIAKWAMGGVSSAPAPAAPKKAEEQKEKVKPDHKGVAKYIREHKISKDEWLLFLGTYFKRDVRQTTDLSAQECEKVKDLFESVKDGVMSMSRDPLWFEEVEAAVEKELPF